MARRFILTLLLLVPVLSTSAQDLWSLDDCIEYADVNNLTLQRMGISVAAQGDALLTARAARLPSLSASSSGGVSLGRGMSRDGTYQDHTQVNNSYGLSFSVPVFQGGAISTAVAVSQIDLSLAMLDLEKARESVELNIVQLYLQTIYSRTMERSGIWQLEQSVAQRDAVRARIDAGRLPESDIYEAESLVASDSSSLVSARSQVSLALLQLKQALNIPAAEPFDIEEPELDSVYMESLRTLPDLESVYAAAIDTRPAVAAERMRLEQRDLQVRQAKSGRYPSLMLSGGYSTSAYRSYAEGAYNSPFWDQLRNNAYAYSSLSLSVPIFSRRQIRGGINSAEFARRSQAIAVSEAEQSVRTEVEQAYYNAVSALNSLDASRKALEAARNLLRSEELKLEAGRTSLFTYEQARSSWQRSEVSYQQARFDFIFRRLIVDFYAGKPISLR